MAAERARAADPQPLGDALGVELVPAQRTRHHADLLAVHEIPEADATLCDAATVSSGEERSLLQASHRGSRRRDRSEAAVGLRPHRLLVVVKARHLPCGREHQQMEDLESVVRAVAGVQHPTGSSSEQTTKLDEHRVVLAVVCENPHRIHRLNELALSGGACPKF